MHTLYTLDPEPESEESRKRGERLRKTIQIPPEMRAELEQHRVTDLLYDAVMKKDRQEFHRLWQEHMEPLARRKEAEAREAQQQKSEQA